MGAGPLRLEAALGQGMVEAALLTGTDLPARIAAIGARPWFTLEPAGHRATRCCRRSPRCSTCRSAAEAELRAAAVAAAGCARLQAALVLPALTPANLVAAWRSAAQRWLDEETRLGWAPGVRPLPGAEFGAGAGGAQPCPGGLAGLSGMAAAAAQLARRLGRIDIQRIQIMAAARWMKARKWRRAGRSGWRSGGSV